MLFQLINSSTQKNVKNKFDPFKLNRGIIRIENIPNGLYGTKILKKYFSQFGDVLRVQLTGTESKNKAYIEFKYPKEAMIAAKSINNSMMFRKRLKAVYISPENQDHDFFKGEKLADRTIRSQYK